MHTETYNIKGMHCASCSSVIEKTLKKIDGVQTAEVNYATDKAKISFDKEKTGPQIFSKHIEPLGYSLLPNETGSLTAEEMGMSPEEHAKHLGINQSKEEKLKEVREMKLKVMSAIPLAFISIFIMGWDILAQLNLISVPIEVLEKFFDTLLLIMATHMLFVIGKPYLYGFYRFLRHGKANMDTLIGIGTLTAYVYSFILVAFGGLIEQYVDINNTYFDVTIIVIAFITLGKYLEARAKIKTGDAIEKLLNLQAKTAIIIEGGKEKEVSIERVVHGSYVVIKPGVRIPVDGIITEGASFVDESMISGEPMPVEKKTNDSVVAGTLNTDGAFVFKATKIGKETLLAHIIKMVEDAQGSRAPIQALADKISAVFVPIVLVLSFLTLGIWLLFSTSSLGFSLALSYGLTSFVSILVIACPCALGLATPTAIIVGVGKGAQEGILIKDAATLEKLHKVDTVVVDKTGTITKGKPELISIQNTSNLSDEKIISILSSLESKSEHPIAKAVLNYSKVKNIAFVPTSDFEIIKGKGLKATIDGKEYFAGNIKLVSDLGLPFDSGKIEAETKNGNTPIILATEKDVLGIFIVADAIKPEAVDAVRSLHRLGIKTVMLTGDHKNTAIAIAKKVGIDEVISEVLPDDKLNKIKDLQDKGHVVVMAGDGINDAPALAQADVGIAMGTGTDVAIETAGITLLHGDISKLVKAIRLSKFTMRGIKQNLFWAFFYNIIGIPLAGGLFYPIFGWLLSPIFAGFAMAFSSVSVVLNSLRLRIKRI